MESDFISISLSPKHSPNSEEQYIASSSLFEHCTLNGFSSLLIKLNINALVSVTNSALDCHACSVKLPKLFQLLAFIAVNVLGILLQCEWKSLALNPSLDARYFYFVRKKFEKNIEKIEDFKLK